MGWWPFSGNKREADLEKELRDHIELEAEEQQDLGMTPDEARRAAIRSFGNNAAIKEDIRETWGRSWADRLQQDVRYAARVVLKSPGFSVVSVLTLMLGIGSSTAIFSQVNAIFWRMLPVKNPSELRSPAWTSPNGTFATGFGATVSRAGIGETIANGVGTFSYPAYLKIRDESRSFSEVACWEQVGARGLAPAVSTELGRLEAQVVSGNYFRALGVDTVLGRPLTPDDDRPAASPVAVISHTFWSRSFNRDAGVLSRPLTINGTPFVIVGVLPKGFFGFDPANSPDIMAPMATRSIVTGAPATQLNNRNWNVCRVIGRLRAGVSDEQARAESEALVHGAIAADPPTQNYAMPHIWLSESTYGLDSLRRVTAQPMMILFSVVTGILLIASANIAGLLLSRGKARQKEIATRLALGASRMRIVRQLVTESLLLSITGGVLGIGLAYALSRFLPGFLGRFLNSNIASKPSIGLDVAPDWRVIGVSLGLSIVTGLVFGLIPALRATRIDLLSMLKRLPPGPGRGRFRLAGTRVLVTLQIALSMLLLIGAGLFIRTVINLRAAALGFEPEGVLYMRVEPRLAGYTPTARQAFFENAVKRLESIPGVRSATISAIPLLGLGGSINGFCTPGFTPSDPRDAVAGFNFIAPRFFETMTVPLIQGRDIEWSDREGAARVVIVNEAFAKKYYGGANPVGQPLGMQTCPGAMEWTVVGLVRDSKGNARGAASATLYIPYLQRASTVAMTLALRVNGDPMAMVGRIQESLRNVDPKVPLFDEVTPFELRDQQIKQERLLSSLLVFFGLVALLLSSLGIYGMLAYEVTRRTPEIGIRMALGAQRSTVVGMMIRESLLPVAAGIALGLIAAPGLTRWVESMLFGISKNDPWTMAAAAFLFLVVAATAALLPSLRASRTDPLAALRYD